jgi:hypothetical protein
MKMDGRVTLTLPTRVALCDSTTAMRTTVILLGDGRESVEVGQGKGQRFDTELGDVWERGRARKGGVK